MAWSTRKQKTVALSSFEAEIVSSSEAACQAVAIRGLLGELRVNMTEPTTLFIDNTSAIDVAKDPMYYDKSKHINRRDLFVRELVSNGAIKVEYIKTKDNPADALTKPLPKPAFMKHRATMLGA